MTLILIQENDSGHIADQWYRVIILNISGSWNMNMKGPLEKRRNIWCHWSSFGFRCWQFSGFLGILPQKLPTLGWKDPWLVAPWRKARAARLAVQGLFRSKDEVNFHHCFKICERSSGKQETIGKLSQRKRFPTLFIHVYPNSPASWGCVPQTPGHCNALRGFHLAAVVVFLVNPMMAGIYITNKTSNIMGGYTH